MPTFAKSHLFKLACALALSIGCGSAGDAEPSQGSATEVALQGSGGSPDSLPESKQSARNYAAQDLFNGLSGSTSNFTWNTLFSGDCLVDSGMRVTFSDIGAATITGQSRSTDTNDRWRMRFEFYRSDGSIVHSTEYFYQDMPERNRWYPFNFGFSFSPEYYAAIKSARVYFHC